MKALIVGLGSIGRRHLANLRYLAPESDITVWRQHASAEDHLDVPAEATRLVYSAEEALEIRPDLAIIAGPASTHVATGLALAERAVPMMIEKPLSNSLAEAKELLARCRARQLPLMVGYNLRFYPPLRAVRQVVADGKIGRIMSLRAEVGQYLPEWRPRLDYRCVVSARHDLGGGVVLELSHELDYVRWIAGEVDSVLARVARLSDLEIQVEDTAEIILDLHCGAVASVHLDMTQRAMTRACRVVGTEGTIVWDGMENSVRVYAATNRSWAELYPAGPYDRNAMYLAELEHFLGCVREGRPPVVGGEDGLRALEIAIAAKESSRLNAAVATERAKVPICGQ